MANNSRISRRLVLYDAVSSIDISKTNHLFIATAEPETGYRWQTLIGNSRDCL